MTTPHYHETAKEILSLSSGLLSRLCGSTNYEDIDRFHSELFEFALRKEGWKDWIDVYEQFKKQA